MTVETPIGIAGTGRMGAAMARRLLSLGLEVRIWNRDPAKAAPLEALGAIKADTPAELAAACPVVISMLFDRAAVEAVYSGPDGLLLGTRDGRLFIEMSTIGPDGARAIGEAVATAGADFVECPVGGTVGPAGEGKLLGLAGGSEQAFARAKPVLDLLCRRIVHAGPVGAGATLKLAVNLPLLVFWQALGEALGLAADLDISPEDLVDLMADTSGAPMPLKTRAADLAGVLAASVPVPVAFELRAAHKDLAAMTAQADAMGIGLPVTAAAREAYAAAAAAGIGEADALMMSTLPYLFHRSAGKA